MKRLMILLAFVALAACNDGRAPNAVVPAGIAPAPGTTTYSNRGVTAQLNEIRSAAGLSYLRRSALLDSVALAHARDMAANNFFAHSGSNGSTVGQRSRQRGYDWCLVAENISKGAKSMTAAIRDWSASPSHYRNMTRRGLRDFGTATAGSYRVMVLGATEC